MALDRTDRYYKVLGNLVIRGTTRQQMQDFQFSLAQWVKNG